MSKKNKGKGVRITEAEFIQAKVLQKAGLTQAQVRAVTGRTYPTVHAFFGCESWADYVAMKEAYKKKRWGETVKIRAAAVGSLEQDQPSENADKPDLISVLREINDTLRTMNRHLRNQ